MSDGISFGFAAVGFMQLLFTLVIGGAAIFFIGGYLLLTLKLGENLMVFFTNWFKNEPVVEEFSLNEVALKPISENLPYKPYSVNGVKTYLRYNINSKLPEAYINILKSFKTQGIDNIDEVTEEHIKTYNDSLKAEVTNKRSWLFWNKTITKNTYKPTTLKEFKNLHELIIKKYSIDISLLDIQNFEARNLDEHGRKTSIECKITEIMKAQRSTKYQIWAIIIVGAMIGGLLLLKAYKIINGA